jgi:GDP-mannose 6-dehydrogenase
VKVTVFGLGYVGCVTAACLAELGHEVTGVDLDETKVALVNSGRSPIIEPGLDELIDAGISSGRLRALSNADEVGEVVLICVGTPSNENGSLGLDQILRVVGDIAVLLKGSPDRVVVGVRSTVLPGTVEKTIVPALETGSNKRCGIDFGICMNPEFMRETTAVNDFATPPFTVIGANDQWAANCVAQLYEKVVAPIERTSIREAEMIKYACNAFHATKICFSNEVGNLSKRLGVDGHRILQILCKDQKLNLSAYYMKPGFAFGGSCLPKDLRAILYRAKQEDVELPVITSLLNSNRHQIDAAFTMVRRSGKTQIGVLGLSFKAGTDDLRESPIVTLIELLIGKGYRVKIYDEEVSLAKLYGANRRFIEQTIPHISSLMTRSIEEVFDASEVIVVSKKAPKYAEMVEACAKDRIVIDLVRLWPDLNSTPAHYEGICW